MHPEHQKLGKCTKVEIHVAKTNHTYFERDDYKSIFAPKLPFSDRRSLMMEAGTFTTSGRPWRIHAGISSTVRLSTTAYL